MAFTSLDSIVAALSAGQEQNILFQKTSTNAGASAAGRGHEFLSAAGIPSAMSLTGTAGVGIQGTASLAGGLGLSPATVSPLTRHLLAFAAWSQTATVVPTVVGLLDIGLIYPSLVVTGTATTLSGSLPTRMSSGVGVMGMVVVSSALGAASPVLTINYTDDTNTARSTTMTAPANSLPLSAMFQNAGSYFIPMVGSAKGIKTIDSYSIATPTTGTVTFILFRQLATIPVLATSTASERDFLGQLPILPKVDDDACLGLMISPTGGAMAASSSLQGYIKLGYA